MENGSKSPWETFLEEGGELLSTAIRVVFGTVKHGCYFIPIWIIGWTAPFWAPAFPIDHGSANAIRELVDFFTVYGLVAILCFSLLLWDLKDLLLPQWSGLLERIADLKQQRRTREKILDLSQTLEESNEKIAALGARLEEASELAEKLGNQAQGMEEAIGRTEARREVDQRLLSEVDSGLIALNQETDMLRDRLTKILDTVNNVAAYPASELRSEGLKSENPGSDA